MEAEQADKPLTHHVALCVRTDGQSSEMSRLSVVNQTVSMGSDRGKGGQLQEHPIHPLATFLYRLDCTNTDYIITPGSRLHLLFLCAQHYLPRFHRHSLCLAHLLSIVYQSEVNFLWLPLSCFCLLLAGQCTVPEQPQGSRQKGE